MKRFECEATPCLPTSSALWSVPLLSLEGPEPDAYTLEARGLWLCPILSPSALAMQSRVAHGQAHAHTHRQLHKTCHPHLHLLPQFFFWAGWASNPKVSSNTSASLELTGQLIDCSQKHRSSPSSRAGTLSIHGSLGMNSRAPILHSRSQTRQIS